METEDFLTRVSPVRSLSRLNLSVSLPFSGCRLVYGEGNCLFRSISFLYMLSSVSDFCSTDVYHFLGTDSLDASDRCLIMHRLLGVAGSKNALANLWLRDYAFDEAIIRLFRAYLWNWTQSHQDRQLLSGMTVNALLNTDNVENQIRQMGEYSEFSLIPLIAESLQIRINVHSIINNTLKIDTYNSTEMRDSVDLFYASEHFLILVPASDPIEQLSRDTGESNTRFFF